MLQDGVALWLEHSYPRTACALCEGTSAPRRGGSVVGRQYIYRDRMSGAWRLFNDYFSDNPVYGPTFFRRRFVISASNLILI